MPEGTHGNANPRTVKLPDDTDLAADSIALGELHACALQTGTHAVWCWGLNDAGQLGSGDTTQHTTRIHVAAADGATALFAGGRGHSCALKEGKLLCWGVNLDGEIGTGVQGDPTFVPTAFGNLTNVTVGAPSNATICALSGSTPYCAGFTTLGAHGGGSFLADGGGSDQIFALPVVGIGDAGGILSDVELLAAGGLHACAKRRDNTVVCWGDNFNGALGNDQAGADKNTAAPVAVIGLP